MNLIKDKLTEAEFKVYEMVDAQTLADYHEIFDIFDQDNDGRVSCGEIRDIMQVLGENPTSSEITKMIQRFDANKSK